LSGARRSRMPSPVPPLPPPSLPLLQPATSAASPPSSAAHPASCAVRGANWRRESMDRRSEEQITTRIDGRGAAEGREQLDGAAHRWIHVLSLPSSLPLSPLFPISPLMCRLLFISLALTANLSLLRRLPPSRRRLGGV
jgi:hypothetical protein